ncbi:MAG: hypothetical protein V7742_01370 [Halioglobus sp.]
MRILTGLLLAIISSFTLAGSIEGKGLSISDSDFNCMLDMEPVRGFYVDNLIEGELPQTLDVANAGSGEYPAGSVVQLVPGEVMVKHPKGFSPATKDWEFFELNVSAEGAQIGKRGFVDVVNRFGGNCFACHAQAKPEFDMICETGHGCDPIPLTPQITQLLQKTDARCGGRYTPTEEEIGMLKALAQQLSTAQ